VGSSDRARPYNREHIAGCAIRRLRASDGHALDRASGAEPAPRRGASSPARRERGRRSSGLATVLFTDIVGSTELAAAIGDRAWPRATGRYTRWFAASFPRFRDARSTRPRRRLRGIRRATRAIRFACEWDVAVRRSGPRAPARRSTGEGGGHRQQARGHRVHRRRARHVACRVPANRSCRITVKDLVAGVRDGSRHGTHTLKGGAGRGAVFRVGVTFRA